MWDKIINNSYLNHKDNILSAIIINITNLSINKYLIRRNYLQIIAENFNMLISKIFLNIKKIIRSLLIVYTRLSIIEIIIDFGAIRTGIIIIIIIIINIIM